MKTIFKLIIWKLILKWIFNAVLGTAMIMVIIFTKWKRKNIRIKQEKV